jgi:membrane protease subunit HflK
MPMLKRLDKRYSTPRSAGKITGLILIGLIAIILFFSSFYTTNEDEYAVVTTFGKPSLVDRSGLHFIMPIIQHKAIVSKNIRGLEIGYDSKTGEPINSESLMITVDYNFVYVDFYLEWQVTDPIKYLYCSQNPQTILKLLAQSYIRDTVGLYGVDSVITTGKSEIQSNIKSKLSERLEQDDLGIMLVNITIQDAKPPTLEVQNAFKAVETAKQGAETAVNNANKYANEVIPAAKADSDQIIKQAEAYKESRINEAAGQAERFTTLYSEYSKYPEITRQRLFYETMEDVLPGLKIIIKGKDDTINTYTPLETIKNDTTEGGNGR